MFGGEGCEAQLDPSPLRSLVITPCIYRCEAQLDLEWEDEAASATFLFQPANVLSQPRLRCGRPRLRGTLHVSTPTPDPQP